MINMFVSGFRAEFYRILKDTRWGLVSEFGKFAKLELTLFSNDAVGDLFTLAFQVSIFV